MTESTLKALDESIAHWERLAIGTANWYERPYSSNCALCQMFLVRRLENLCLGCPVMEKTGITHCKNSPWEDASYEYKIHGLDSPEFRTAAALELEFLKGLRP